MKRGREEKNSHETLPSPTRLRHGGVINIPLDVTVEILKKLPTKSLLRFQCVSKLWSSIISSRRDLIDSIITRSLNEPPRDAHIISLVSSNCFPNRICKSFIAFSSTTCPGNTDKELVLVPGQYHQSVRGLVCCWSHFPNVRVVEIWVMETQGWSKFFLCEKEDFHSWSIAGTTRGGEIVLVKSVYWSYDKLRVYYYDLKGNSMRYVDLENCYTEDGNRKGYASTIWTGPDHVENIMGLH
ncbi:hypothetical protein ARALYDRAFT_333215 [Arabidopsis lyrata subsp. lyrata]|uniref:F-box domain-containing protein n=1 Tax=Arabidopsis lyrata subsp. lyrata TaxID=81972 RepID=D7MWP0_ARALL|nr:hypothetical protein ARALYDRAFT_333215 [Arabidopsis lyrata subsp. lyrata]